jgi:hypothetical protein
MKIAIAIRGHVRDGLTDAGLRNFLVKLNKYRDIEFDIYCHSWKETEAKSSYRKLDQATPLKVTPQLISHYFGKELQPFIRNIAIEDDSKIPLRGKLEGTIALTPMPILAWKRMWHGKVALMKTIADSKIAYDSLLCTRFDMFTTPICQTDQHMLFRIIRSRNRINFKYPIYTRGAVGVDNFYCGDPNSMITLITNFYNNLDEICQRFPHVKIHEQLLYEYAKSIGYV